MREYGYGSIIKRVMNSLDRFLFDEFIFCNEEHRDLFWKMHGKCVKTDKRLNFGKAAVIYLLSADRVFGTILENYVSNPLYILPKMYNGSNGEEQYNLYHAVRMLAGMETGLAEDFEIEGEFPKYGNDDDRADNIGVWLLHEFLTDIKKRHTYRNSEPTTSILTITSNVVYGKYTGNLPDGRRAWTPFAPGANPLHGRDTHGAVSSLASVAKIPFENARDGISDTFTVIPDALGKDCEVFTGDLDADELGIDIDELIKLQQS